MGIFKSFKKRKPWAASIVAFIFGPAIGMLYLSRGKLAILYIFISLLLFALPFIFAHFKLINAHPVSSIDVYLLLFNIFGAVHCFIQAQKEYPATNVKWYARWYSLLLIMLVFGSVAILSRVFVIEPFDIPSSSMSPNINKGDYLFIKKNVASNAFERGDIVVFKLPSNPDIHYIHRIVGMPGETVQMKNGSVFINGKKLPQDDTGETFLLNINSEYETRVPIKIETLPNGEKHRILDEIPQGPLDNTKIYNVPAGHFFVMGDNRDDSYDSRISDRVGFIPVENIIGKDPFVIWNGYDKQLTYKTFD